MIDKSYDNYSIGRELSQACGSRLITILSNKHIKRAARIDACYSLIRALAPAGLNSWEFAIISRGLINQAESYISERAEFEREASERAARIAAGAQALAQAAGAGDGPQAERIAASAQALYIAALGALSTTQAGTQAAGMQAEL